MSKWCQAHWDMLREEVNAQGMGDMVSANGEIAAMRTVSELKGEADTKEMFDPLMRAFWMIENRLLEGLGAAVLHPDFGCPLCRIRESRTDDGVCKCPNPGCPNRTPGSVPDPETWIKGPDSAVTSLKQYVEKMGWLS